MPNYFPEGDQPIPPDDPQRSLQKINNLLYTRPQALFVSTADKTVFNTTTETSLVGTGVGSATLPANLLVAGRVIKVTLRGLFAQDISTFQVRLRLGGVAGTAIVSSASGLNTGGVGPDAGFQLDFEFTCRTAGTSGTVVASGFLFIEESGSVLERALVNASTTSINTTEALVVTPTLKWSGADGTSGVTIQQCVITSELPR